MSASLEPASAAVLAAGCIFFLAKGIVMAAIQVLARIRTRSFARPEDARLFGTAPIGEPAIVMRIAGAWRNETENTPIFLGLAVSYVMLGGAPLPFAWITALYAGARLVRGLADVRALQPLRTVSYLIGLGTSVALAALLATAATRAVQGS